MTQTPPAQDPRAKCETCNGTGFVPRMGGVLEGDSEQAVEACPTCDGSGLKDPLSHRFPTPH